MNSVSLVSSITQCKHILEKETKKSSSAASSSRPMCIYHNQHSQTTGQSHLHTCSFMDGLNVNEHVLEIPSNMINTVSPCYYTCSYAKHKHTHYDVWRKSKPCHHIQPNTFKYEYSVRCAEIEFCSMIY